MWNFFFFFFFLARQKEDGGGEETRGGYTELKLSANFLLNELEEKNSPRARIYPSYPRLIVKWNYL